MFYSFTSIPNYSASVGGNILTASTRQYNVKKAHTMFRDSSGPVIKVNFKYNGPRGNNYVANLYKINATKYRFRLYGPDGTRLNTVTQEDATPPSTVIAQLVDLINNNNTFKKYIHVTFLNETTEAMSDSTDIGDGQTLTGGR